MRPPTRSLTRQVLSSLLRVDAPELAARHPEVLRPVADRALPWLSEGDALSVERPFRDALDARDVARARLADLTGAPTAARQAGEDVARTFVAEAADARA